jgi:hypothetical protein
MDDLAEGSVFAELQIGSWPPPATQTLLRKTDARLALTVRGKPSGRLRVALEREGFEPIVVRTLHLRLRTPTVLKVQVAWRADQAIVVAAGQVIGSTAEFYPEGVVTPAEVAQSAPPVDHVDNARMRELRRKQTASFLSGSASTDVLAERWLTGLRETASTLEDLSGLVQQGRRHHLAGMMAALRRLVLGEARQPALLQFCAGIVDAPLILYVPAAAPHGDDAASLLASAFDATTARDADHGLAIDLDAWLRQEVPWLEAHLPVGWLLRQAELALTPGRVGQGISVLHEDLIRSPSVTRALCALAESLCGLADGLVLQQRETSAVPTSIDPVETSQPTDEESGGPHWFGRPEAKPV